MIASLPMYVSNLPQLDVLWRTLATHLSAAGAGSVPQELTWPANHLSHWRENELLMSQSCGFPLMTELAGQVRLVGTFRYSADGCDGIFCRSKFIVRSGDAAATLADLRGRTVAFNSVNSQSGYNSLRAQVAPLSQQGRFFGQAVQAGSHRKSVEMVRDGLADVASIDCISLAEFERYSPEVTRGIRVLAQSDLYPGLPLITSARTSDTSLAALRAALVHAMQDPTIATTRGALFIEGFEPVELSEYQVCVDMRDRAFAMDCPTL